MWWEVVLVGIGIKECLMGNHRASNKGDDDMLCFVRQYVSFLG